MWKLDMERGALVAVPVCPSIYTLAPSPGDHLVTQPDSNQSGFCSLLSLDTVEKTTGEAKP